MAKDFVGRRIICFKGYERAELTMLVQPRNVIAQFCDYVRGPYMFTRRRKYRRPRETVLLACEVCGMPVRVPVPIGTQVVLCSDCEDYVYMRNHYDH